MSKVLLQFIGRVGQIAEDMKREGYDCMNRPNDERCMKKVASLAEASMKVRKESLRVNRERAAIDQAPKV